MAITSEPKTFPGNIQEVYDNYLLFFKNIYLFLAMLGLHCYEQASSSCSDWGLLSICHAWALTAVASVVAEHRI